MSANARPRSGVPEGNPAVLVACPACHGLTRVPTLRLSDAPRCPRCKGQLLAGTVFSLDAHSFPLHAERAGLPLLVDFWAPWCGPCRMMAPVLEQAASQRRTQLQIGKLNTDAQPALAARFGIRSIPTLILLRAGHELARQSGAIDLHRLGQWLDTTLGA